MILVLEERKLRRSPKVDGCQAASAWSLGQLGPRVLLLVIARFLVCVMCRVSGFEGLWFWTRGSGSSHWQFQVSQFSLSPPLSLSRSLALSLSRSLSLSLFLSLSLCAKFNDTIHTSGDTRDQSLSPVTLKQTFLCDVKPWSSLEPMPFGIVAFSNAS